MSFPGEDQMPMPLRKFPRGLRFNPDALDARPLLAIKIARISAAWTDVEIEIALLLASALDTHANAGIAMYLALIGSAAQDSAFQAALKHGLPAKMVKEITDVLNETRARAKERNRIIHCIWGITDDFMDGLIRCPPDGLVRDVVRAHWAERGGGPTASPSPDFVAALSVYKERDFVATEERIVELKGRIKTLGVRADRYHQRRRAQARKRGNGPQRPA